MNEEDIKEELKDVGTVFCGVYKDNTPTNIYLTIKPEDGTTDISKGMVVGINIYANEKDMLSGNEEMCDICIYGIKLGTPMSEVIEILNEPSYKYEGEEHQFTISVGYAEYPVHADKPSKLMRCADTALYEVKLRGKNGCMAYKNGLRKDIRTQLGFALKDVSENLPGAFIIYKADKNDDEILFANHLCQ